MPGEVVYRKASDERVEVSREGDGEPQYVARAVYRTRRRDEPGQSFEEMGGTHASLEDAVEACLLDAAAVAAQAGAEGFDGGLSFHERGEGEWVAREYDTLGCDWMVERVGWTVQDQVNGGEDAWLDGIGELDAYIESEIDKGWF